MSKDWKRRDVMGAKREVKEAGKAIADKAGEGVGAFLAKRFWYVAAGLLGLVVLAFLTC